MAETRHLLLLTIDAWRADFLGSFLGHPLVPALDRYAACSARRAGGARTYAT